MQSLISRRRAISAVLSSAVLRAAPAAETRQATGVKIGEITSVSAVIWTRLTKAASRLADGIVRKGQGAKAFPPKPDENIDRFEGACPGGEGSVRVHLELAAGRSRRRSFDWVDVRSENDFAHQFRLHGLEPATEYRFAVETRGGAAKRADEMLTGSFRTAPRETDPTPVRFALSSCQIYCLKDRADGFEIYEAIEKRRPAFLLSCGDNVYYDSEDPVANSPAVARYHWQRM